MVKRVLILFVLFSAIISCGPSEEKRAADAFNRAQKLYDAKKFNDTKNRTACSSSIAFCHRIGLDYVSCSPFRVPVARLAAAQAALQEL